MRNTALVAIALLSVACGGDDPAGPEYDVSGTYTGDYTALGGTYEATIILSETGGDRVVGSLTTTAGRTGTLEGSIDGLQLNFAVTFTDDCRGTADAAAGINNDGDGPWLGGGYEATDCLGSYSGGFTVYSY